MQVRLLELRFEDLARVDQQVRALHSAQIIQGGMLGLLVELFRDRFARGGADLEAIEKVLLQSQALSKGIMRVMDKEIGPRDQVEGFVEDLKALFEGLPDD